MSFVLHSLSVLRTDVVTRFLFQATLTTSRQRMTSRLVWQPQKSSHRLRQPTIYCPGLRATHWTTSCPSLAAVESDSLRRHLRLQSGSLDSHLGAGWGSWEFRPGWGPLHQFLGQRRLPWLKRHHRRSSRNHTRIRKIFWAYFRFLL